MHKNVRRDHYALIDQGFRAARGTLPAVSPRLETTGHVRLAEEVPDLEVDYDEATQLPKHVASRRTTARLAAPPADSAVSPEDAVMHFIQERGALWNLTPEDAETVRVVSSSRKGLNTVNLIQQVGHTQVFGSDLTVAVGRDGEVLSTAGQLFPGAAAAGSRARTTATTSEVEAIARAAFDLTDVVYEAADFSPTEAPPESGPYRFYHFVTKEEDPRPAFERPVRVKDVLFPLSGEGHFVLGYYMELWIEGFPTFSYVLDAVDTDVLYRKNLTYGVAFKYRVHNTGDAIFRPEDGPALRTRPGNPTAFRHSRSEKRSSK
jgi:extracellular elastinolytic metalloproteinase